MDASETELLLLLKSIGSIKHANQKIRTETNMLVVEQTGYLNSLLRWYYGENRQKNIQKIDNLLAKVFALIDTRLPDIETHKIFLTRLLIELDAAKNGLGRLKETYTTDVYTASKLEVLIENISIYCTKLFQVLPPVIQKKETDNVLRIQDFCTWKIRILPRI